MEKSKTLEIGKYQVSFPFEPYPQQVEFMKSLIECIDGAGNALLESPTGTGKTLSLLTGALAWMKGNHDERKNIHTKLFYSSRTHSQISQLISELKSTPYIPTIAILASRDHLCINSELSELSGGQKITKCQQIRKSDEGCSYFNNLQRRKKTLVEYYANKVLDVEELFAEGVNKHFCPYYFSKVQVKEAHVVFLPYTFLTNDEFFWALEKDINNGIIVFDEAHNVGDSAEEVILTQKGKFS